MTRILIITPTPTHPTTQGNRARVYQIGKALKQCGATVDLLYYSIDGLDGHGLDRMREAWDTLYVVGPNGYRAQRTHPAHWGLDDWISPSLIEATRAVASSVRYDAVVVNYVWCSLLFSVFSDTTLRVLDTHDAFGGRRELAIRAGLQPHWFYTSVEEEARGLDRADIVLAIQPEEGQYFSQITSTTVKVLEYAIPPSFLPARRSRPNEPLAFGYLGSSNPWNVRAVAAMEASVKALPAGSFPSSKMRFLLFGGITKSINASQVFESYGLVDEVSDAYMRMDVVVNPMIGGTGLKIKTVEGLAYGRPVLSTKAGACGLGIAHADLLHEDVRSLVERIVALADNPIQASTLAGQMQSSYSAFFSAVSSTLDETMREIAAAQLPSGPVHRSGHR